MKEHISEAEALEDMVTPQECHELAAMLRETFVSRSIGRQLQERLETVKAAKTGDTINCPTCDKEIVKTTYHKTFCSNAKTHGKRNCKDRFHNVLRYHTDPTFAVRVDTRLNR